MIGLQREPAAVDVGRQRAAEAEAVGAGLLLDDAPLARRARPGARSGPSISSGHWMPGLDLDHRRARGRTPSTRSMPRHVEQHGAGRELLAAHRVPAAGDADRSPLAARAAHGLPASRLDRVRPDDAATRVGVELRVDVVDQDACVQAAWISWPGRAGTRRRRPPPRRPGSADARSRRRLRGAGRARRSRSGPARSPAPRGRARSRRCAGRPPRPAWPGPPPARLPARPCRGRATPARRQRGATAWPAGRPRWPARRSRPCSTSTTTAYGASSPVAATMTFRAWAGSSSARAPITHTAAAAPPIARIVAVQIARESGPGSV